MLPQPNQIPAQPPFTCVSHRRQQKRYTVFVARVRPEDRAAWRPQLNEEHSAWRWFPLAELQSTNAQLHPVVALALQTDPHRATVVAAVTGGAAAVP